MSDRLLSEPQRDRFQDRYHDEKRHVIKQILDEIESVTKRLEKQEKSFVCYEDLKGIWSDHSRISTLLLPESLSQDEIDFIQGRMIIILSTLVSAGASACLANFRTRLFYPNSSKARITDNEIPLEKDQLSFLDPEPASQQNFYDYQFRFKPVVIEITSDQRTQVIKNQKMRLPFEYCKKDVGAGGYGKVDCVGISPRYIKEESGSTWEDVHEVACKKITQRKDFKQEVDNLQILKESLTLHHRIMLHLAIIEHGLNCYILLPYAKYGDLEQFLHCGIGPDGERKYDFDKHFNEVRNSDVTLPLLNQCYFLANALAWLHTGFKIEKSPSTVFCAHMDLKPANILIQDDYKSVVGKWMISDFGISVVKAETKRPDSEFGSIRDYYSQLTMNTRPKRHEGTYQAPEVKLSENVYDQPSRLTPDQKGIGRRSDIWSYGCIFSEVLAFALGRDELVIKFQSARKRDGNDYFYDEKVDQRHLQAPDNKPKQYQIYPPILSWLDGLCDSPANTRRWVDCYVETIKKILIVDTADRPDATGLSKLVEHVKDHVDASRDNSSVDCNLLRAKDGAVVVPSAPTEQRPPIPLTPAIGSPGEDPNRSDRDAISPGSQIPLLFRSDSDTNELLHGDAQRSDNQGNNSPTIQHQDESPASLIRTESATTEASSTVASQSNKSIPSSGQHTEDNTSVPNAGTSSRTGSSTSALHVIPVHAHGIMTDPAVHRIPNETIRRNLAGPKGWNHKATCVTLTYSKSGIHAAYLAKSSVYIYVMNVENMSATLEREVELPQSDGWKFIAVTGYFLAAWGFSSHKLLHLCDIREPQRPINLPSSYAIETLESVAISEQGVAALLCRQKILVVNIGSQTLNSTLSAGHEQKFTDAAFNDSGDHLFAWAYGQKDSLYVWRCQDGVVNEKPRYQSHYKTDKKGKPYDTRVIPYNTYSGCIIETPNKCFFAAQIGGSLRGTSEPLPRNHDFQISNVKAACIFQDHSMITVEKGNFASRPCLKEYKLEDISNHLRNSEVEICKLEKGQDESPRLLVVKHDEDIIVIVCSLNEKVDFVKIVPV